MTSKKEKTWHVKMVSASISYHNVVRYKEEFIKAKSKKSAKSTAEAMHPSFAVVECEEVQSSKAGKMLGM